MAQGSLTWQVKSSGDAAGSRGPAGPQGPVGPSGELTTYIHVQSAPLETWVIEHNLGRYPSVTVVDSAGSVVSGDVVYDSSNVIRVTFGGMFSGRAYLN